ncbi:ribosome production factor 2 [Nematocida sp. AWRm77]|nr:ribosome production factor 2 [Nematocida sp. AWRm77]
MKSRKEKDPVLKEPPKKLLVLTQAGNSPKTRHIADLFVSIKRNSLRYIDKEGLCVPSVVNTEVSNGRLEEQMKRLGASLFVYINTVKSGKTKLLFGRTYEYEIVDTAQFELHTEEALGQLALPTSSLALVLLNGRFESPRVQNLMLDVFREDLPPAVGISMCTHACGLTVSGNQVTLDMLKIHQAPFSLSPLAGPLSLTLTGSYHCEESQFRASKKFIRQTEKKVKNVEHGPLKSTLGVLHMERQDLSELRLTKGKALRGKHE